MYQEFCPRGGGGWWYPSMHCRWYPSMPCRSLGWRVVSQHALQVPGGVVSQHALQISRPTHKGEDEGPNLGGSQGPHLGGLQAHTRGGIPACTEADIPTADGYCCGRYASYWNAFLFTLIWKKFFLILHLRAQKDICSPVSSGSSRGECHVHCSSNNMSRKIWLLKAAAYI